MAPKHFVVTQSGFDGFKNHGKHKFLLRLFRMRFFDIAQIFWKVGAFLVRAGICGKAYPL